MRFLKLLFGYLVIGVGLLGVGVLVFMYMISFFQASKVAQAITSAKQLSRKPAHVSDCMVGESMEEYPLLGYQVRFENDKDFVVEAICTSSVRGPFKVNSQSLKYGVTKEDGYSGVLFPTVDALDIDARLVVRLGYARWLVNASTKARVQIKALYWNDKKLVLAGEHAAIATCEGWGFSCCNDLTQVGVGEGVAEKIASCNSSCYIKCLERPSVLIFTTEPELNPKTREVAVNKSAANIIFSYSVQDIDSEELLVSIDYGDGQQATSNNQTDQFSHVYVCSSMSCTYRAKLSVLDESGLKNSRTRISDVLVRVR